MRRSRHGLDCAGLWVALCAVLAAPAGDALAQEPPAYRVGRAIQERIDRFTADLASLRTTPLGLIPLERLSELSRWYPRAALADALREVAGAEDTDPVVRALAGHRYAAALLAGGDLEASQQAIADQGYVTTWSVVGPFANDGMAGFAFRYPPEESRDLEATYPGRLTAVGWRDITPFVRLGFVDLSQIVQPSHAAVAYAATTVESPRSARARLWMSAAGAYKLWLNGALVGQAAVDLGGGPVREWWDVTLERGANELVVKVAGEDGPLGFTLRVTDRSGEPIADLVASPGVSRDVGALSGEGPAQPSGSVLAEMESLLLGPTPSLPVSLEAALAGASYVIGRNRSGDPTEPWRRFLREDATCAGGGAEIAVLCAMVHEHHWERHRYLLDARAGLDDSDPEWPWVVLELAQLGVNHVGATGSAEAAPLLDEILAVAPDFVPARVLLARLYERETQTWTSEAMIGRAMEEAPDSPEVVSLSIAARQQVGLGPDVVALYRRRLALEADSHSAYTSLLAGLLQAGDREAALEVAEEGLSMFPASLPLMWMKAEVLLEMGDGDAAEAVMRGTVEVVPGDARAWERLGRFYAQTLQQGEAQEAFRTALLLEPQNQSLADYLTHLRAEEEAFYSEYVLDLEALQALEVPESLSADRDYTTLVDQEITQVFDNGLSTRFVQRAYRVQTRLGADALRTHSIQYTPGDQVVEVLSARVLKPDGSVRESFSRWEESLSQPWYGLYYDLRALVLSFEDLAPGDVLELSYTLSDVSERNMFDDYFGSLWFVQGTQPTALARYGVIHPDEMILHFRPPRLPHERRTTEGPGGVHDVFEVRNVPRVETEESMPGFSSVADYIHVSTFESWSEVSDWYWNLISDQLVSSPEIEATVADLVQGLSTTRERVAAIHEYVVRNTRYVGLEFGIHGYRPYRTTVSFARRFGDCKDTASLMKVMLALAGIDSRIVLVRTRDLGNIEETPASLSIFNHAITYVPELGVFLDGTAGHNGVDELPAADQGASVLLVADRGEPAFTTIPMSAAGENRMEYTVHVDLREPDHPTSASATGMIVATGQFAPPLRRRYEAGEHRDRDFQRQLADSYPGAQIEDVQFEGLNDITRPVAIEMQFTGVDWYDEVGQEMLMRPLGVQSSLSQSFAGAADRRQPLLLPHAFQVAFQHTAELPAGTALQEPERVWRVDSPFGAFRMTLAWEEATLQVTTLFELTTDLVSPSEYGEFRAFLQQVDRLLNRRLRLTRAAEG